MMDVSNTGTGHSEDQVNPMANSKSEPEFYKTNGDLEDSSLKKMVNGSVSQSEVQPVTNGKSVQDQVKPMANSKSEPEFYKTNGDLEDSSLKKMVNGSVSQSQVEPATNSKSVQKFYKHNGDLEDSSLENMENGSVSEDLRIVSGGLITDKMLEEERLLEEKSVKEEQVMRRKMLEQQKKDEEEKCFKRLKLLLSRSGIYAKFMAEKLQKHEALENKQNERKNNSSEPSESIPGKKRKAEGSLPKKRFKPDNKVMDVYKKENMGNMNFKDPEEELVVADVKTCSLKERQPGLLWGGEMRLYQIEGYEWLKTLFENGVNGILADEMGLGKTIQCIAFIAYLVEMGVPGPFFVCGPLSTVPNWCAEFKRFTPDIPVILYHGDKAERQELRLKFRNKTKFGNFNCYPVVITSYQIALIDAPKIRNTAWKILVIDEAHRIKNFQCKLVAALKSYNAVHRLLLTGTPLQNNLSELWSLLNFILPEIFDDLKVFESWFDISRLSQKGANNEIIAQEQEKQIISTIHEILTPFLLRRTKQDVELQLPQKKEVIVHAPLTSLQQKYYKDVLNKTIEQSLHCKKEEKTVEFDIHGRPIRASRPTEFFGVEDNADISLLKTPAVKPKSDEVETALSEVNLKLRNAHMILRRICCHPYLISYPLDPLTMGYLVDEDIVKTSGKLLVLDQMLPELQKRGHKILLFSQFVTMLQILEDYCTFRGYKFTRLYGMMNLQERQEEMKEFSEDDSTFIFLISTKAGGLGLNLVAADTVIIYDSDWNPQGDLQAQDRCHRIGQTKPVVVYRLVIPNTMDAKIMDYASAKRKLEKVIIQKGRFCSKDNLTQSHRMLTIPELKELLECADADTFVTKDGEAVLSQKEIEKLLDRSDMIAEV